MVRGFFFLFFFQAEDGIRDLVRSRGLGDVYKRQNDDQAQDLVLNPARLTAPAVGHGRRAAGTRPAYAARPGPCLLYTSDAADERSSVDLGGRRIIKKKNQ